MPLANQQGAARESIPGGTTRSQQVRLVAAAVEELGVKRVGVRGAYRGAERCDAARDVHGRDLNAAVRPRAGFSVAGEARRARWEMQHCRDDMSPM